MGKFFWQLATTLTILSTLLFATVSHAEIQTYTGEGIYIMSEGENLGVAKERAKANAMRNACEQAGVYVESRTEVRNLQVDKDEIITMTSNILQLIEEPHFYPLEEVDNLEGIKIRVTVKAKIDDTDINRWLNKGSREKAELVAQNEALRKANEEQERQITELKRQLAKSTTKEDKEQITQKFANADKKFLSNQKFEEAQRFYDKGDYESVIRVCTEAIELNHYNPLPYSLRSLAYLNLNKDEEFYADSDKFKELFPYFDAEIYKARGDDYIQSGQYERAIQNYSKALELNPNDAEFYKSRGIAYINFGVHYLTTKDYGRSLTNYELAIQDFNKAINLNQNDAMTWCGLGTACSALGQYEQAIIDFNRALKIDPKFSDAYFKRGMIYVLKGNFELAIADMTKLIELDPNNSMYWQFRGGLYQKLGYNTKAQADFAKAKQLGYNG